MTEKLNNAAMRAARLRAELKRSLRGFPLLLRLMFACLIGCFSLFIRLAPRFDWIQDPSKPKAFEKRKERAPYKVVETEKAVAKARAEWERAKYVEVNNPSAKEGGPTKPTEGGDISLHSSDFQPVGSPQYTPLSPPRHPTEDLQAVVDALAKPFNELNRHELDARWTMAINYVYSPPDQEVINKTSRENETNELFFSRVEVGFACFIVTSFLLVIDSLTLFLFSFPIFRSAG